MRARGGRFQQGGSGRCYVDVDVDVSVSIVVLNGCCAVVSLVRQRPLDVDWGGFHIG